MKLLDIIQKIIKSLKVNGLKYTILRIINVHIIRIVNMWLLFICKQVTKKMKLKDIIIIQSHGDFDCNGVAIYDYLLENKYNQKYKIVWFLKYEIPKNLPYNVEAYSLYKIGIKQNLRICLAKYFFADDSIIIKVRNDQVSTYCSHGILSLKNITGYVDFKNKRLDYCLSPSENVDFINRKAWNIENENNIKLIHLGYPCQDIFFKNVGNEYSKITNKKFNKYILWMPTFRKGHGNRNDSVENLPYGIPLIKTNEMLEELNQCLHSLNILLTIKFHPGQDPKTYENLRGLSNIKIITIKNERELHINKYALMKNTDALISDYSSVSFEYMLLNRPIAYIVSDVENYKIGFIMKNPKDYMPGPFIKTLKDFVSFVKDISNKNDTYKAEREELIKFIYKYQDGNSCTRLVNYLNIQ